MRSERKIFRSATNNPHDFSAYPARDTNVPCRAGVVATTGAWPTPRRGFHGLVYVVCKNHRPHVQEARTSVDGALAATVASNVVIALDVPIGISPIRVEVTDGKPYTFRVPVERAEDMFVVLTGGVRKTGMARTRYEEFTGYVNRPLWADGVTKEEAQSVVTVMGRRLD